MSRAQPLQHIECDLVGGGVDVLDGEEEAGEVFGVRHDVILQELVQAVEIASLHQSVH